MPEEIDDATKRRLIYIKKLYLHGHEHIPYQTEFDRMIAIHHLDNAIELLLKCVATKLGISFRSQYVRFPELWNAINERTPLTKKTEIFKLHNFRSNVQHWGISPFSTEVVNRFDVYVSDFIREVMKQVFKTDFEELFMSSLVEDETLRKILTTAEKAFERGNYKKCIRFADAAFNRALQQQREESRFFVYSVKEEIREIADIAYTLALGVNYIDYKKYKKFSPRAEWHEREQNVRYPVPFWETYDSEKAKELKEKMYSRENALFNLNFVLECILKWHL